MNANGIDSCLECVAGPDEMINKRVSLARELEQAWTRLPVTVLEFECPVHGSRHWWWFEAGQKLAKLVVE